MAKIYPFGSLEITVESGSQLFARSESEWQLYQIVGAPNFAEKDKLISEIAENTFYSSGILSEKTKYRLDAHESALYWGNAQDEVDPESDIYNQGETGAVDRTVVSKLQENVSVKDFGAVGDGVTDDTIAIQSAATYGGDIYIPAGTYIISDTIYLSSNTYLQGAGKGKSILYHADFTDLTDEAVLYANNKENIYIKDITVDGNRLNQTDDSAGNNHAISFENDCDNLDISGVETKSAGYPTRSTFAIGLVFGQSTRVSVVACESHDNNHYGFNFYDCVDVSATANFAHNNGSHGFGSAGCTREVIDGNTAYNNGVEADNTTPSGNSGHGIWIRNMVDTVISNNIVRRDVSLASGGNGITFKVDSGDPAGDSDMRNTVITGNVVEGIRSDDETSYGIYPHHATNGQHDLIITNNFVRDCDRGIYTLKMQRFILSENRVQDCTNGIVFDDALDGIITNNVVGDTTGDSVVLTSLTRVNVIDNQVTSETLDTDNTYYAFNIDFPSDCVISGNSAGLNGAASNLFKAMILLSGAFAVRNRVSRNLLHEATGTVVEKDVAYGASGSDNYEWSNQLSYDFPNDFYEEGTFLPTVIGSSTPGTATYSLQEGTYTRKGNILNVAVRLAWSGGTGAGNLLFDGFPVTVPTTTSVLIGWLKNITIPASSFVKALTSGDQVLFITFPSTGGSNSSLAYDAAGEIYLQYTANLES